MNTKIKSLISALLALVCLGACEKPPQSNGNSDRDNNLADRIQGYWKCSGIKYYLDEECVMSLDEEDVKTMEWDALCNIKDDRYYCDAYVYSLEMTGNRALIKKVEGDSRTKEEYFEMDSEGRLIDYFFLNAPDDFHDVLGKDFTWNHMASVMVRAESTIPTVDDWTGNWEPYLSDYLLDGKIVASLTSEELSIRGINLSQIAIRNGKVTIYDEELDYETKEGGILSLQITEGEADQPKMKEHYLFYGALDYIEEHVRFEKPFDYLYLGIPQFDECIAYYRKTIDY